MKNQPMLHMKTSVPSREPQPQCRAAYLRELGRPADLTPVKAHRLSIHERVCARLDEPQTAGLPPRAR
jgi:hypothetical protein